MADESVVPKVEDDVIMGEADSGVPPAVPAALSSNAATISLAVAPSPASAANAVPSRQSTVPPDTASIPQGSTPNAASTPTPTALPTVATPHGAPTRRYLNEKVTGALLEGMKELARDQPRDPLRVLGEYLLKRSREVGETA